MRWLGMAGDVDGYDRVRLSDYSSQLVLVRVFVTVCPGIHDCLVHAEFIESFMTYSSQMAVDRFS